MNIGHCTRCGDTNREIAPIFNCRPGGHSLASVEFTEAPPPKTETVCADCLTDEELARMLHSVTCFVLGATPRDYQIPSLNVALETVAAMFMSRSNGDTRRAALRAAGFTE